ncbi:uncharacterized protein LOC142341778 [Convolutriloba macropyga]|uniref:uncharacterized protein LOC142341778 n=1 Tax=Convolutriloba macropyga TaxID=536237 RepID=UPI003F520A74
MSSFMPHSANALSSLFSSDPNAAAAAASSQNRSIIQSNHLLQQTAPPNQAVNPQTHNSQFSSRIANTFGNFNPIQQTFEKFSPLQNKTAFARQPSSHGQQNAPTHRNLVINTTQATNQNSANFYRFSNSLNPNTAQGLQQNSSNFTVPSQFRLNAADSPNYIQLAAEKVASFLNTDSASTFKNPFSANFFGTAPGQANPGLQRNFLSRTSGNISGSLAAAGDHPGKVTPSLSMGLGNQQLSHMQQNQSFGQTAHVATTQANPGLFYQPITMQGNLQHGSSLNPTGFQQIVPGVQQQAVQQRPAHVDVAGNVFVGMQSAQPTLQQAPNAATNVAAAAQFARKPAQNLIQTQGAQYATPAAVLPNQAGFAPTAAAFQNPQQIATGFTATNIQGATPAQLEAEQRFRRSKDLFQQSQTSKLNPGSFVGVNTGTSALQNVAQLNSGLSGSYQSVFSDPQLNQTFQAFQQQPSTNSILNPTEQLSTLQRQQPMYVSMDGGLNLINQQKNNDVQLQQQNLLSALERSRALDRLSIEQLYTQQRSRSLDQTDTLNSPSIAGTGQNTPNLSSATTLTVPNSQIGANSRFPQFPVDLAHRLHAQHATGYQIPPEFSKRSVLDSGFRPMDQQLLKNTLDTSLQPKSVSFNVNQSTPTHSNVSPSLTKLSELFPDCAECRRLEENRRLFRASLKLGRPNPSESWSDYMKENDRFISSQDEDSLRKLAKMVSATFSGDSDSADSEGRFTRGYGGATSDYPYTSRYAPETANKLGHGFGSVRSLPSSYVDQLESSLARGVLDSPGSLRARKTNSLSEVDMQRRLEMERDLMRPSRSRAPSHDYLVNTEYAKAAAYAAELNQKLGAFTAEMENLSLDRSKLRGRSRDRKTTEKDRRMSSRDNTTRERSKSRTLEDSTATAGSRLRSASPEHVKMSRRLDRIGKSARDYSPVGVSSMATNYADSGFINDGFSSISRSRNRSSSKTRINNNYDETVDNYSGNRRRLGSNKERNSFVEDDIRKKPGRDRNRESRRGSFYELRPHDRRFGNRDVESSSSSIDRLSSPDRRNRKAGTSQINQSYDVNRTMRDRSSYRDRDRIYERTVEMDKSRRLPEVPGNNYSNESGYSSQSQRATRDDNERYARNNSSNHRDANPMYKPSNHPGQRDNRGYYPENDYYNNNSNFSNSQAMNNQQFPQNNQGVYSNQQNQQNYYGNSSYNQDSGYGMNANDPYRQGNQGSNYNDMHVSNNPNQNQYQQNMMGNNNNNNSSNNNMFMNQQNRGGQNFNSNYNPNSNYNNQNNPTFNSGMNNSSLHTGGTAVNNNMMGMGGVNNPSMGNNMGSMNSNINQNNNTNNPGVGVMGGGGSGMMGGSSNQQMGVGGGSR